jgi:hypothetical protein
LNPLFAPNPSPDSFESILWWWEKRRIPYNVIVGFVGAISGVANLVLWDADVRKPDEIDGSPGPLVSFLIFGFLANVFFTSGWITEVMPLAIKKSGSPNFAPRWFRRGLYFSLGLALFPGVFTAIEALIVVIKRRH